MPLHVERLCVQQKRMTEEHAMDFRSQAPMPSKQANILDEMSSFYKTAQPWLRRFSHARIRLHVLDFAPSEEPCPSFGEMVRRHQTVDRGPIIDVSLEGPILLLVEQGVYSCRSTRCRRRSTNRRGRLQWRGRHFRKP